MTFGKRKVFLTKLTYIRSWYNVYPKLEFRVQISLSATHQDLLAKKVTVTSLLFYKVLA